MKKGKEREGKGKRKGKGMESRGGRLTLEYMRVYIYIYRRSVSLGIACCTLSARALCVVRVSVGGAWFLQCAHKHVYVCSRAHSRGPGRVHHRLTPPTRCRGVSRGWRLLGACRPHPRPGLCPLPSCPRAPEDSEGTGSRGRSCHFPLCQPPSPPAGPRPDLECRQGVASVSPTLRGPRGPRQPLCLHASPHGRHEGSLVACGCSF